LKHRITNAFAEGTNSVIQLIKSSARGFRNFENYRTAILFFCGGLEMFFANFIFLFTAVQDNFILLTPIAKEKYKDHESEGAVTNLKTKHVYQ